MLSLLAAAALAAPAGAAAQSLAKRLTTELDQPPLDRHQWGIAVLDQRGRLVFGRNADRMFMPASNAKLIVTSTATVVLGPESTVRTPVYATGTTQDGTLEGDLILAGRGDPTWSGHCFETDTLAVGACVADPFAVFGPVAAALRARGVRRIAGAVVGDGSWFEPLAVHPTWENDDLVWGYAAPVTALGFNENLVAVLVEPTLPGSPARLAIEPDLGGLAVVNRVVTVGPEGRTDVSWRREGLVAIAEGTIRTGGRPDRSELAVPDPSRFAALALRRVLADSGIEVLGGVRSTADSTAYASARSGPPVAVIVSRPTRDWVFRILNVSQNWIAEMLLKRLGREAGTGGSWQAGLAVERRFLIDSVALDSTQFLLHDGSGLSAKNAVSPLTFVRLLDFMRKDRRFAAFAAGLPQAGAVGSLRSRYLETPLAGRVRAKTGSIGQVNTLSGFILPEAPGRLPCRTFSVQANHHGLGGRTMIQAIDSVVVAIGAQTSCAATPRR